MRPYFYMLLGIFMFTISCTNNDDMPDEPNKQDIPELLFGKWIYTDNENEDYYFCQGISFNSTTGYWQISQQEYNDLGMCGGTMTYDTNAQTLYLNCTLAHEHLKMDGVPFNAMKIINLTNDKLTIHIADKTIEYIRNNEYYIIPDYVWTDGSDENLNPKGKVPSLNDNGVDLGLSVYWADYNVGSTESTEVGGCYGWGDVTGTYYTKDETMYPSANPPSDISGTEYDIASNKWGNGWRIPTKKEMEELIDNCYITWQNWCKCWEFTSRINGNSIKFPYASVRNGKSTFYDECGYWTSTLDRTYMGAYALYTLKSGRDMDNINHFKRSYGLQIRPVKDKDDEAKKLIGTWVGYDGTPGLESTDKYTITLYSSGKATEVCSYSGGVESTSGTYKYSNGEITEWEMEDCSALANTLGDPSDSSWTVTFITPTEITIGDKYYSITFTRQ